MAAKKHLIPSLYSRSRLDGGNAGKKLPESAAIYIEDKDFSASQIKNATTIEGTSNMSPSRN